jgi:hypothetical protein
MYGGMCHAMHFLSCMDLKNTLYRANVDHDWLVTTNESLIQRARNTSAAAFLDTKYQKMLFIDADISFEPDAVAELWNMDAPVAVGAYRMKRVGAPLTVWKDGMLLYANEFTEPTPVDYAGTGFMMIDRSVFERLMEAHPEWEHMEAKGGKPTLTKPAEGVDMEDQRKCWGFFQTPIRGGIQLSEDYFFCEKVRELGIDILWNPRVELTHWGLHGY